jgi:hypothetical protein
MVTVLCFLVVGCVSPETAAKIDSLEGRIQKIAEDHAAGKLSTQDAVTQIKPLLEEMKAVRDAEGKWYEKLGYVLLSVGSVVLGRFLGIPGLRSGSAPNLATAVSGALGTKK